MSIEQLGFDSETPGQGESRNVAGRKASVGPEKNRESTRLFLSDLAPGMDILEVYLVSSKEIRITKAGKPFLRLRLSDRTATAECVAWENAEALALGFEAGDLVTVAGRASEYEGKVQIEARTIKPCPPGQSDPRDFLPSTYRDVEELKGFLQYQIDSVYDRDYAGLLEALFGDAGLFESFCLAPAAKQYHHAYLGGLLEHTVGVADLCDHVSQQYGRVNRDLLLTAALLHDIGKVRELTFRRTIDFSDEGRLLGHVILGVTMVGERIEHIPTFPDQKRQLLLHAIASHHGELEWGSPKRPKTLEALILHHTDNLDAKVKGFLEIVDGSRNAEWTDLRNLFRRPLHMPKATHQELDFMPPLEDEQPAG